MNRRCVTCAAPIEPPTTSCRHCTDKLRRLKEAVQRDRRPIRTPRDAALEFLRFSVYAGATEQELRLSHSGSWNDHYHASIGGYQQHPDGSRTLITPDKVIIAEVNRQPCSAVFALHGLYQELKAQQQGTWQPALFEQEAAYA